MVTNDEVYFHLNCVENHQKSKNPKALHETSLHILKVRVRLGWEGWGHRTLQFLRQRAHFVRNS